MELHITKEKDSRTIGAQLISNNTLIDQVAVNCDDDTMTAIDYTIDKYRGIHGAFDVFINGKTHFLV